MRLIRPVRSLSLGAGCGAGLLAAALALAAPPAFPPGGTKTLYAGVDVADPYRAVEKLDDPLVRTWTQAQGAYTRAQLDALAGLPKLRARIEALDRSIAARTTWAERSSTGRLAYLKRRGSDAQPKLYVRDTLNGAERLLLDPEARRRPGTPPQAINNAALSPDGRYVAVVVSTGDSELGSLEVLDATTGARVGAPVPNVWGEINAMWLPDSRRFLYGSAEDPALPFARQQLVLRTVVAPPADPARKRRGDAPATTAAALPPDRPLLGWKVPGAPPANESDWLWVQAAANSDWLVAFQQEGVNSPPRIHAARLADLDDPKKFRWKEIATDAAALRPDASAVHVGDRLYARTFRDAGRFAVVRFDLDARKPEAEVLVPEQAGVIDAIAVAADALYYVVRGPTTGALYRLPHGAKVDAAQQVALPFAGSIDVVHASADVPGLLFRLQGWTESPRIYAYSPAPTGRAARNAEAASLVDTGLTTPSTVDTAAFAAVETACTARDGAKVPLSMLGRKNLKRDRLRPTILLGYGGYGITETARFNPTWLAWLERGGVIAVVNPRGSGAFGEAWYRAGAGATKPNTWRDTIDCAQYLIDERWTEPAKLSVWGISMGGVLAGRAITERPDLFGTAFLQVGILDAVRFIEATSNGPNHELEMGSVNTREGVQQLLTMSAYHQVRDGVRYPATLLMHGLNDSRVVPWQTLKMTARLQAASTSGRPVLLRLESEGGHGVTAEAQARYARLADMFAFQLWQVGDPEFQPR
jgi:prolyl oligopeptidase